MVMHHLSHGHHSQIKMRPHLEATKEEEEHVKLEKETSALKSFTETKCIKRDCLTEHESTRKATSNLRMGSGKESSFYFDFITNGMFITHTVKGNCKSMT